jgi:hypothetical protein
VATAAGTASLCCNSSGEASPQRVI